MSLFRLRDPIAVPSNQRPLARRPSTIVRVGRVETTALPVTAPIGEAEARRAALAAEQRSVQDAALQRVEQQRIQDHEDQKSVAERNAETEEILAIDADTDARRARATSTLLRSAGTTAITTALGAVLFGRVGAAAGCGVGFVVDAVANAVRS